MVARSNNWVLLKARGLCLDAGVNPDQLGEDGAPAWCSFVGDAQSLEINQQSQEPLTLLKAIEKSDSIGEGTALVQNPPSFDPLEKLQALFEHEMAPSNHTRSRPENSLSTTLINDASTLSSRSEDVDPLEVLRALEMGSPKGDERVDDAPGNGFGYEN